MERTSRCQKLSLSEATGKKKKSKKEQSIGFSEISSFITAASETDEMKGLEFWKSYEKDISQLCQVAMKVLAVPATSVPVESEFNHGGIVMYVPSSGQNLCKD